MSKCHWDMLISISEKGKIPGSVCTDTIFGTLLKIYLLTQFFFLPLSTSNPDICHGSVVQNVLSPLKPFQVMRFSVNLKHIIIIIIIISSSCGNSIISNETNSHNLIYNTYDKTF